MSVDKPKTLVERIRLALIGPLHHQWMYDKQSLSKLLERHGFVDVKALPAGQITIAELGALNLSERSDESGLFRICD